MSRTVAAASTHFIAYSELLAKSLRDVNHSIAQIRGGDSNQIKQLLYKADRIPLLPDELKSTAVTFFLFEADAFINGSR